VARPPSSERSVLSGRRPVLELLRAGQTASRILIADNLAPSKVIGEIRKRAGDVAVPVRVVPRAEIDRLAPDLNHQGVVAVTARYRYSTIDALLKLQSPVLLFLDGITDVHNLGSLLRSADGAGWHGVIVPTHHSAAVTPAVRRVSAGAAEVVPVARVGNLSHALDSARAAGLWIVGLDAKAGTSLWKSAMLEPPLGLVLGSEDRGISRGVRDRCDELVRIPSAGRIGSLNVGVAGAIAMFEVARRMPHPAGE
jgi:23S rRNA (guanosine2251-2'-O)-methyltransferase